MRLITARFSSLFIVAAVATLIGWSCGGSSSNSDAGADGKKDAADGGTGGKGGGGGSGGSGIGTGGNGTGTGGAVDAGTGGADAGGAGSGGAKVDAPVDNASADKPDTGAGGADAKPDAPHDLPAVDAPHDAADAAAETHPDAAPEAAPETAHETAPDVAAETAPEAAPDAEPEAAPDAEPEAAVDTPSDTPASAFMAITPCNSASDYVTAPTTITFPTSGGPAPYTPNCLKVSRNAMVTWMGNFADHPLETRDGGTAGSPIQLTNTNVGSKSFTFANPGFFPYRCMIHSSMTGVIWVTD